MFVCVSVRLGLCVLVIMMCVFWLLSIYGCYCLSCCLCVCACTCLRVHVCLCLRHSNLKFCPPVMPRRNTVLSSVISTGALSDQKSWKKRRKCRAKSTRCSAKSSTAIWRTTSWNGQFKGRKLALWCSKCRCLSCVLEVLFKLIMGLSHRLYGMLLL